MADISISRNQHNPKLTSNFPYENINGSLELITGFEYRFKLHALVETYIGTDLVFGFGLGMTKISNPALPTGSTSDLDYSISTGLGLGSGILVKAIKGFHIGLNLSPTILFTYSPYDSYDENGDLVIEGTNQGLGTYFNSSSVQLLFMYRWEAKPKKPRAPRPPLPQRAPRATKESAP